MLTRILLLTVVLASTCYGADHNVFKNCSEIDLCNSFRTKVPDNVYTPNIDNVTFVDDAAMIDLNIDDGKQLKMNLTVLINDNFRLIIEEVDSKRYHLQDVLEREPTTDTLTISDQTSKYVELTGFNSRVVINKSPFTIEFYLNNNLEVVFDGSRLIFDKDSDAFTFSVSFPKAAAIYGIHEHADRLALQNTAPGGTDPYRLKNFDTAGFEVNSPMALYGAVPVLYGHGVEATAGIFLQNAAEQWHEISSSDSGSSAYIIVDSGVLDLFVLLGPTPQDIVRQYTSLTGVAGMPQFWTLGYHQCRNNYDNDTDVKDVIANLDQNDFPVDVIWLDIGYTDGKRYFTWDLNAFKDPIGMQQNLSSTNRKLVAIIDPHIKVEDSYEVYAGGLANGYFVLNANGTVFEANCWPGLSTWMDFLNPDARAYYGSFYNYSKFPYTTETLAGFWNDMNEPSVFGDLPENTLPGDTLQYGNVSHRNIHNIYGFLHTISTYEGLIARDPEKRPFVLTRSHFAGTQRFATIWTGDNQAQWEYLAVGVYECLNANILGIVFCGSDVGGFIGDPSEELIQRWFQVGAWIPFYREHSIEGSARREPYVYGTDVQNVIRNAIRQRYEHIYVLYALFYWHYVSGDPIIRPLFYHYPNDANVIKIDQEFLFGPDILVAPVLEQGATSIDVYFPGDDTFWLEIHTGQSFKGNQTATLDVKIDYIPVFYRAGSIIPLKVTPRRNTEEMKDDPFTIVVNLDKDGNAAEVDGVGTVYIDDYESFNYKISRLSYWKLTFGGGSLDITTIDGSLLAQLKIETIIVNTLKSTDAQGSYSNVTYTTNVDGTKISDIIIQGKDEITIKLF